MNYYQLVSKFQRILLYEDVDKTRLFRIEVKIRLNDAVGGGIEQKLNRIRAKLNRIRAIEGVTVVGHEMLPGTGAEVMSAKIKFHPPSNSTRPMTYVREKLVPEINSELPKHVPGAKVIEVVAGSLKRLDR
jgi:hypothetical protein